MTLHTMNNVCRAVAGEFGLDAKALKSTVSNTSQYVMPRQIAMMLMRDLVYPQPSYPEIGRFFHGMHHTTVLYGVRKIRKVVASNVRLQALVARVTDDKAERPVDYYAEMRAVKREVLSLGQHILDRLNYIEERERARMAEGD